MKKYALVLVLNITILTSGLAQESRQFYAGAVAGLIMPNDLHEQWHNIYLPQTADLWYEMKKGLALGIKLGYHPEKLKQILQLEIEYNYQQAGLDILMTPGFTAMDSVLPGFSQKMEDSHIAFHSVSFNVIARAPNAGCHPYIGFGPGITHTLISFNEPDLFGESGSDTGFSYQIILGVDFDLTSTIALGLAYKYYEVNPIQTWANGTHSHYDPRMHNYLIDVKYKF